MAEPADLSAHAVRNRDVWNADAPNWVESGRKAWASPTPTLFPLSQPRSTNPR